MTACLDLATDYGHRYRIVYEEQAGDWPPADRPWLARIACRYGHVGVQGGERLHAFTDRPRIGAQLRGLDCERAQGDTETRIVFHVRQRSRSGRQGSAGRTAGSAARVMRPLGGPDCRASILGPSRRPHLDLVLAILRPYRRRRLNDAHRAKLVAAGTAALAPAPCGNQLCWSIEAAELARHLDALPLPSADMLHRRLIDVADLAEALGVSVPRLVTVAQLVAAHVVAVVALLEARR